MDGALTSSPAPVPVCQGPVPGWGGEGGDEASPLLPCPVRVDAARHTVVTPDPPPADDVWALVHGQPCRCGGGATMPPHPLAHLQPARAQEDVQLYRAALGVRPGPAPPAPPPAPPAWEDGEARLDLVQELLVSLHALMLAVLRMRMQRDQVTPLLFRGWGLLPGLRSTPTSSWWAPCRACRGGLWA